MGNAFSDSDAAYDELTRELPQRWQLLAIDHEEYSSTQTWTVEVGSATLATTPPGGKYPPLEKLQGKGPTVADAMRDVSQRLRERGGRT